MIGLQPKKPSLTKTKMIEKKEKEESRQRLRLNKMPFKMNKPKKRCLKNRKH